MNPYIHHGHPWMIPFLSVDGLCFTLRCFYIERWVCIQVVGRSLCTIWDSDLPYLADISSCSQRYLMWSFADWCLKSSIAVLKQNTCFCRPLHGRALFCLVDSLPRKDCIFSHTHTHTHTHKRKHKRTHTHSKAHNACIHTRSHVYALHTHTHIHSYTTHAYIHAHTCIRTAYARAHDIFTRTTERCVHCTVGAMFNKRKTPTVTTRLYICSATQHLHSSPVEIIKNSTLL